ncbi:MAG: hypothetical protein ACJAVK_001457 [Akkermansiaceae bacterium]|jgi:hypothetical protein
MRLKECVRSVFLGGAFAGILASCSTSEPNATGRIPLNSADPADAVVTAGLRPAPEAKRSVKVERPGIATGWGREVGSAMTYTDFQRAASKPKYVSTIRYNDSDGAKEMGVNRKTSGGGMQKAAGGLVEWGMSSGWGMLDNHWWRGGRFVIGKKGREYQLKIKNVSHVRLEVVMSVDGLDVIDGEPASTKKRGYIIGPGKTLSVKGFRTSQENVATFKFSSVGGSYANQRHGNTRNVGVVGLALFTEKGREPGSEFQVREGARPFAEAPPIRARD